MELNVKVVKEKSEPAFKATTTETTTAIATSLTSTTTSSTYRCEKAK